jgi:hypothetical protein
MTATLLWAEVVWASLCFGPSEVLSLGVCTCLHVFGSVAGLGCTWFGAEVGFFLF